MMDEAASADYDPFEEAKGVMDESASAEYDPFEEE